MVIQEQFKKKKKKNSKLEKYVKWWFKNADITRAENR